MFHWICPECGQEIAPGVKECPLCEPQASTLSASSGNPSVATAPAPVVTKPVVEEPVPEPQVVLQPEVVLQPQVVLPPRVSLQPGVLGKPKPPVVLEALPAETPTVVLPVAPPDLSVKTPPRTAPEPTPEPETFADRLADLAEHLHGERMTYTAPRIFQESAAERSPVILDVAFHAEETPNGTPARPLLAPPPSMLLLAEPQPPAVANGLPVDEVFRPRPAEHAPRPCEPLAAEPSAQEPVHLPTPPERVMAPGLAPLQDYHEAAERQMRPAEYATKATISKALPTVTLPGPALPRELMSLQAAGLVPIRKSRGQGTSLNRFGWMTKYVVVGILLTAGVATYTMLPGTSSSAPPRPSPNPDPEPPVSARTVRSANSLARFVEVTGIRFMEVNKKPQIQYLVVNHSGAPLGSVMVYVTLRSGNAKPGQPPIARLTFRSPALAAFEAKEMFSSIERAVAPLDLPDWQDLHADVEVQ